VCELKVITRRKGNCCIICLWTAIISQLRSEDWQVPNIRLKHEEIKSKINAEALFPSPPYIPDAAFLQCSVPKLATPSFPDIVLVKQGPMPPYQPSSDFGFLETPTSLT
jgi:hypothetical protein